MFNLYNFTNNDDFVGSNADVDTEFDYHSFYRAYVKSTDDPENLGRIRICIPSLHSDVKSDNEYPYAYPGCMVGLGNQVGQFILPPVDSIVFVTFEKSDEHRPIYFGGVPTQYAEGKTQTYNRFMGSEHQVTEDDVPIEYTGHQSIIYKSPTGCIIYTNDTETLSQLNILGTDGQQLQLSTLNIDGAKYTSTTLAVDEDNSITLNKDLINVKISGEVYKFDNDKLKTLMHIIETGGSGSDVVIPDHEFEVDEI